VAPVRGCAREHRHHAQPMHYPGSNWRCSGPFRWRLGRSVRPSLKLHKRHGVLHSRLADLDLQPGADSGNFIHPSCLRKNLDRHHTSREQRFRRLLMSRGCDGPASPPPLRGEGYLSGLLFCPQTTEIDIDVTLRGNARVGLCLHEHNVQVVTVAMWCRWTGFCSLRISTSSDALIASCFGKFQKPKTAPQVQF
jgi:hypothetical protein